MIGRLSPPSNPNQYGPLSPHRPAFWIGQIVTWSLLQIISFVPAYLATQNIGVTGRDMLFRAIITAIMGLSTSSALAQLYLSLPERYTTGKTAVLTVLGATLVGAVIWVKAQMFFMAQMGVHTFLPPSIIESPYAQPAIYLGRLYTILGIWSAIFVMLMLNQRVQWAHAHAISYARLAHEAQLKMLRSQLNPHFLFNALNSVVGLIGHEPKKAQAMVRDLSALLRSSLEDKNTGLSTIGDELDFVHLYLNCEKIRFEERLEITIDVPAPLRSKPIPSMSLHPLVENAIKHGMHGQIKMHLHILGKEHDGQIELEVINSGQLSSAKTPSRPGTGTGLKNVRGRIEALFPNSGQVNLTEEDNQVVARIRYEPTKTNETHKRLVTSTTAVPVVFGGER